MKRIQILIPLTAMAFAITPLFANAQTTGSSSSTIDTKKTGNNVDPGVPANKSGVAPITDQAAKAKDPQYKAGGDASNAKGMGNNANPGMAGKDTAKAKSKTNHSMANKMPQADPNVDSKGGRAPGTSGATSPTTPTAPNNTNTGTGR